MNQYYWKGNITALYLAVLFPCLLLAATSSGYPAFYGAAAPGPEPVERTWALADTNIEVLLYPVGVDYPASGLCGHFNLVLEAAVSNTGSTGLGALQVEIALSTDDAYGTAYQGMVAGPELTAASRADLLPIANPAFDGRADLRLLTEAGGRLLPGETLFLRFTIELFPEAAGAPATPQARAWATGVVLDEQGAPVPDVQAPGQPITVDDWSDDGPVFDGTRIDPDDPTLLGDCWRQSGNLSARSSVNITLDAACQALVTPATILSNFAPACDAESLPEGGYYRLYYNFEEISEPIDASALVGESLVFQVKSVVNPCAPVFGTVRFRDNSPPVLECPETRYFTCADIDAILNNPATLDPDDPRFTGVPVVRDNCSENLSFSWSDAFYDFGCAGGQIGAGDGQLHAAAIVRTFTAVDASGNLSPGCRQVIYFDRPPVAMPAESVALDICRETIPLDDRGNPHPERTGYPFFLNGFGDTIRLDGFRCQYSAAYNDQRFAGPCPGAYKVIRLWQVYDWCQNRVVSEAQQVIEVGDFEAPGLVCSTLRSGAQGAIDTLTFSTGPFNCTAAFVIPEPFVEGECSTFELETAVYTYRRPTDPFGNPYGEPAFVQLDVFIRDGVASGVPPGTHYFVYTARDACGNVAVSDPCVFKVTDAIEPIAICAGDLTVSLGGSGLARLLAADVDKGSRDNCGAIDLSVRRRLPEACLDDYVLTVYGVPFETLERAGDIFFLDGTPVLYAEDEGYHTPWAQGVFVTCCDAGETVSMDLRVRDGAGNANTCTVAVAVEDKLAPAVQTPPDLEVWCDELAGLDLRDTVVLQARFGNAVATDNCRAWTRELEAVLALDECGIGTLTRRFQAIDEQGNLSRVRQQQITVTARHDYLLRFPADAALRQCDMGAADSLDYESFACDFLAVNIDEEVFIGQGDACRRILRTYRVINWCEYDNESDPVVIGRREDPAAPAGMAVYVMRGPGGAFVDNNEEPADGFLREVASTGYWQYTQIIDWYDDEAPVVEAVPPDPFCSYGGGDDCDAPVELSFSVLEGCSPESLQVRVFVDEDADNVREADLTGTPAVQAEAGHFRVTASFPLGAHQLIIEARDGCGNLAVRKLPFSVVDCKAPAPVCIGELTTALSPVDLDADGVPDTAWAELEVNDLLASELFADCSGPLRFSINRPGERPDPEQQQLVLGCDDLGGAVPVEIYAWDAADNPYAVQPDGREGGPNYDFCTVLVTLIDPGFHCVDVTGIAGHIVSEDGIPIQGVSIQLSGRTFQAATTDADGRYEFGSLAPGNDYSLRPLLDTEPMNGVSTLDLVRISKHILNVTRLDSPYKMLAADVNRSGTITILDLIQLRRLILGVLPKLPQNTSWRFVQASYPFQDPAYPFAEDIPEALHFKDLVAPVDSADFIGLKVGDVTGDAGVDNLTQPLPRDGAGRSLTLEVEDVVLQPGEQRLVAVLAGELEGIDGFQFTLEGDADRLAVEGWMPGRVQGEHLAFFPTENSLTVSWDRYSVKPDQAADTLLTLIVRAKESSALSESLHITSRLTKAEAYDDREAILAVHLRFGEIDPLILLVGQNYPNPFAEQTTFDLVLPREEEVFLQVRDVNGQVHWQLRTMLPAGRGQLIIPGTGLPSGLLFYTVEAGGQTITKKMIRLP